MQFLSIKNVHTMHFLFVFKILFEEKGGGGEGNFWRPQFALWRPKLDRQLAPVLKS